MTTTDFIKLLTENEFGGATGRPREVMFEVDDEIFETDGVEVTGSGDGLFAELFLSLPSIKRKKGKWIEKFDRIIRELGVNCAYDMPSFWCNQGKDYKVIPTQYHKGYMQALADVEKHMKGAEE